MTTDHIILPFNSYFELAACIFSSMMLGFFIHIIVEILIEYLKYPRHYDRLKSLLWTIVSHHNFRPEVWASVGLSLALMARVNMKLLHPFSIIVTVSTILIARIFVAQTTHVYKKFIRQETGLDYGSGMASNYFHGFINIVLPRDKKGFEKRIKDYQKKQKVLVAVPKLFILLPHSLHSENEFNDDWIEKSSHMLKPVVVSRAGVRRRRYTVGVYRFKNKLQQSQFDIPSHYYVIAECATPLLPFYESINNLKATSTTYMEDLKLEVVKKFSKSLKRFIESTPGTRGLVEIIYFNDEHQKVGEVLEKEMWKKGIYPLSND